MKNISGLTLKIGERIYQFVCEVDAPIGEIHDALSQFKDFAVKKINELHQDNKKPVGQDEQSSNSND